MTWNPSVRQAHITATARPTPQLESVRMKEMEGAAVAAVAMMLACKSKLRAISNNGQLPRQQSAWIVQGRMEMTNRWFT